MNQMFKLKNGSILLLTEAPGGIYNSTQLKKIASLSDEGGAIIKVTEDQRLALFIEENKINFFQNELQSVGLGIRHYQSGIHQPVSCIGELCEDHKQDSLGAAMSITEELHNIELSTSLKIGINGCASCCVPCHTLDVSIFGEDNGYKINIGGKNSQIPEIASFVAEGVPSNKLPFYVRKIVEAFKDNANENESLLDLIERKGSSLFIEALSPYSQDAASVENISPPSVKNDDLELDDLPGEDEIELPNQPQFIDENPIEDLDPVVIEDEKNEDAQLDFSPHSFKEETAGEELLEMPDDLSFDSNEDKIDINPSNMNHEPIIDTLTSDNLDFDDAKPEEFEESFEVIEEPQMRVESAEAEIGADFDTLEEIPTLESPQDQDLELLEAESPELGDSLDTAEELSDIDSAMQIDEAPQEIEMMETELPELEDSLDTTEVLNDVDSTMQIDEAPQEIQMSEPQSFEPLDERELSENVASDSENFDLAPQTSNLLEEEKFEELGYEENIKEDAVFEQSPILEKYEPNQHPDTDSHPDEDLEMDFENKLESDLMAESEMNDVDKEETQREESRDEALRMIENSQVEPENPPLRSASVTPIHKKLAQNKAKGQFESFDVEDGKIILVLSNGTKINVDYNDLVEKGQRKFQMFGQQYNLTIEGDNIVVDVDGLQMYIPLEAA